MFGIISILIVTGLIAIIIVNTIRFKSKRVKEHYKIEDSNVVLEEALKRFSEGIKIETVSYSNYSQVDWAKFEKFREYLQKSFPGIQKEMERVIINEHSIVYKWIGEDEELDPILLTAHQDVVPIEVNTEGDWTYPPFSGEIQEGYVWGRGTLDTKVSLISSLEAAENLIKNGFRPRRSVFFAFGHDEEVGGREGAVKIAEYFKAEGVKFHYVLDEGGCFVKDSLPGIHGYIGYVGIGEKGYANIEVDVMGDGGHASMPPRNTSLGNLSKIITRLEKNQMKMKISKPVREFLEYIGPEMGLVSRIMLSNLWIFSPLVKMSLSKGNTGNALLRTTTAATMARASMEPNVLPQMSGAVFNFRVGIHDTCDDLIKHIKKQCGDIKYSINAFRLEEPSKVSPTDNEGFRIIEKLGYGINPGALMVPYVVMAGTDARKYEDLSEGIYRFTPFMLEGNESSKIHSTDECISVQNYKRCIDFYYNLMKMSQ